MIEPLPLEIRLALKPWFTPETLDQVPVMAAGLPEPGGFFYRHWAAAVFPAEEGRILLSFQETDTIRQGFRIADIDCSLCGGKSNAGDHCRHAAYLAAGMLTPGFDTGRPAPLPLQFADSPWGKVGRWLAERVKSDMPFGGDENGWRRAGFAGSRLEVRSAYLAGWDESVSCSHDCLLNGPAGNGPAAEAWHLLLKAARSENEKQLNRRGHLSQGQRCDSSQGMRLCRFLAGQVPRPVWRLRKEDRLRLEAEHRGEPFFRLFPAGDAAWFLLRHFEEYGLVQDGKKAKAVSRFTLLDDGRLRIDPWLLLPDGSRHEREGLEDRRYGERYSLDGVVFYSVAEQTFDFGDDEGGGLPLFNFAAGRPGPPQRRIIAADEVPVFLAENRDRIFADGNEVCEELKNFSLLDLPDRLEVADYWEEGDWCYLAGCYDLGGRKLALDELLELRRQGVGLVPGPGGRWLQLRGTPLAWLHDLGRSRLMKTEKNRAVKLSRQELVALSALVPELTFDPRRNDRRSVLASRLSEEETLSDADFPAHLRTYQKNGLAWLHHLYASGIGAVLADDMGLGKTHQALGLVQLAARRATEPVLVVCPTSVISHWEEKILTFYPDLRFVTYYGPERTECDFSGLDMVLTSYGVMRQDIETLQTRVFPLVIFDEIQYLRNRNTVTSRAASNLHTSVAVGLTGTPLENSLTDLKTIFDLCLPGLLGADEEFVRTYRQPIEEEQETRRREVLQRLLRPFMLRRLRGQVLTELPERIEDFRTCRLSEEQTALYREIIDVRGKSLLAGIGDRDSPFPYLDFLSVIHRLKQVCNHPALLANDIASYRQHASGKWDLFVELLQECLDGSFKVVVFSQYIAMLDLIEHYLHAQGIVFGRLRGDMDLDSRRRSVAGFNEDPAVRVFCASLLAGGTGVDLTGAQAVIHYDRWWNAAREEQATGRVHRLGQKKVVQVFKLMTAGTLEEKIHSIIERKKNLADEVVSADESDVVKRLSREDLVELLQWQRP